MQFDGKTYKMFTDYMIKYSMPMEYDPVEGVIKSYYDISLSTKGLGFKFSFTVYPSNVYQAGYVVLDLTPEVSDITGVNVGWVPPITIVEKYATMSGTPMSIIEGKMVYMVQASQQFITTMVSVRDNLTQMLQSVFK